MIVKIHQLVSDPNLLFIINRQSIHLVEKIEKGWNYLGEIEKLPELLDFIEDNHGIFWFQSYDSLRYLKIDSNYDNKKDIKSALLYGHYKYITTPPNWLATFEVDNITRIVTDTGICYFDHLSETIHFDSLFGTDFPKKWSRTNPDNLFKKARQSKNGDIWFIGYQRNDIKSNKNRFVGQRNYYHAVKKSDGTYEWKNNPLYLLQPESIIDFYLDDDGITWYKTWSNGIFRYDPENNFKLPISYPVYVKGISNIKNGESNFKGHIKQNDIAIKMPYESNSLQFSYGAHFYELNDSIFYRFKLESMEDWSLWQHNKEKIYVGLSPGTYTFKVQATNIYHQFSEIATLDFEIVAPWYLTYWAYISYILIFMTFVYGIVKVRVTQLEKDKSKLEVIVKERTTQLEKQAEQLKELDRLKTRFFSNISHEFKTPLTLILGPLKKLVNDEAGTDRQTIYQIMERNGNRLLQLINQLLDINKLEAKRFKLRVSKSDLNIFIKSLASNYTFYAEDNNIKFLFNPYASKIDAYFDKEILNKILNNLLSNAFKFTPEGGKVSINLVIEQKDNRPMVRIDLRDTGIGIPEDKIANIFERFYQVDNSMKRTQEGSGIGLALTKELVDIHKGTIHVDSKSMKGTRFTLFIPQNKEAYHESEIKTEVKHDSKFQNPNNGPFTIYTESNNPVDDMKVPPDLLVVEDNADMRAFIVEPLKTNYSVMESGDGKDGWKKAKKYQPQLIISDVMMPEMDGVELCNKLKSHLDTSHIPVILLTAKADQESRLLGLETGADDYLAKPFDEKELKLIIHNRIKQNELIKEKFRYSLKVGPKEIAVTPADQKLMAKLMEILDQNMENFEFDVNDLADSVNLSLRQLHRKTTGLVGLSPSQFIRNIRLKRAADLLKGKSDNISQIAFSVGFNNLSYFNRCFKETFHQTPREFLNS